MRQSFAIIVVVSLFAATIGCKRESGSDTSDNATSRAATNKPLLVAAAISMKEALTDIASNFKAQEGGSGDIDFSFEASGMLMGQIKNGAPIDVFISAADKQVADLDKAGLVDMNTRRVIVTNSLVLIVPASAPPAARPTGFADLADARFKHIAVGEPKSVPAGQYAAEVLKSLKIDVAVHDRLVYGINVRQVLDYVDRGEVDGGIVYATDARQSGSKVAVVATADPGWHEPIEYPGVVVKASTHPDLAKKWLDYLGTDAAAATFRKYGFSVPAK